MTPTIHAPWLLVLVTASLSLAACGPGDPTSHEPHRGTVRQAVIDGELEPALDAVLLTGHQQGAGMMCTGTLILPNLVLTARHCVASNIGLAPSCPTDSSPGSTLPDLVDTGDILVYSTDDITQAGQYLPVAEVLSLPQGDSRPVCGADIVALRLNTAAPVGVIDPRLDSGVTVGEALVIVGFGAADPTSPASTGSRRRRDDAVVEHVGAKPAAPGVSAMAPEDFQVSIGPCSGDSGGPALDGSGKSVGVMSRGAFSTCEHMVYTGLSAHAEWVKDIGRAAAQQLGQAPPAWAQLDAPEPGPDGGAAGATGADGSPSGAGSGSAASGGGCALPRAAHSRGGGWLLLVAASWAWWRRRPGRPSNTQHPNRSKCGPMALGNRAISTARRPTSSPAT
ncbi:MAG: trypsin-like serine protease [Polyangiaceae bacterium]|nr:trypsin-like serine protease [Polyangiaceae bacterium]